MKTKDYRLIPHPLKYHEGYDDTALEKNTGVIYVRRTHIGRKALAVPIWYRLRKRKHDRQSPERFLEIRVSPSHDNQKRNTELEAVYQELKKKLL